MVLCSLQIAVVARDVFCDAWYLTLGLYTACCIFWLFVFAALLLQEHISSKSVFLSPSLPHVCFPLVWVAKSDLWRREEMDVRPLCSSPKHQRYKCTVDRVCVCTSMEKRVRNTFLLAWGMSSVFSVCLCVWFCLRMVQRLIKQRGSCEGQELLREKNAGENMPWSHLLFIMHTHITRTLHSTFLT